MLPKDAHVSGNDVMYELPNDVATRIRSIFVALDDID